MMSKPVHELLDATDNELFEVVGSELIVASFDIEDSQRRIELGRAYVAAAWDQLVAVICGSDFAKGNDADVTAVAVVAVEELLAEMLVPGAGAVAVIVVRRGIRQLCD